MTAAPIRAPITARIGPNAITRVAEVLPGFVGRDVARHIFELAGLSAYLRAPPEEMVDECEVTRLHAMLREALGGPLAHRVAQSAGLRTAEYLLARRIPKPVQALLKALPAPLAARVLLVAIRKHAWTFSGSGVFEARAGAPVVLTIRGNPLCRGLATDTPACAYYAATFEHLFRTLVHRDAQLTETDCEACGGSECRFEVHW
jgi:divinyl protochlorophyllide a 8-vinyl-reductase